MNDKRGHWNGDRSSTQSENQFIQQHGFEEYAHWHLAIDESHGEDSKARYKFPFGDFQDVHRCALIAVEARARQYNYPEIAKAARELLELVERQRR